MTDGKTDNMILGSVVDDFRRSWELQRNYMWEAIFPTIGLYDGIAISKYCQDVKFGDYGIAELSQKRYGAYRAKYAGMMEIPNMTATFLKPSPDLVSAYFYYWKSLITTDRGYFNVKFAYARTAYIYIYNTAGKATERFKLMGVFPKTVPNYDLNYVGEDITRLPIEFNVDRIYKY